ncbi:hypothetical protein EVAR_60696_1 [Eumeta japonica]|uniref:THAP-type domain-containing protein n=1 Tax=Eumeta variegata TaxID=151549 RepID=A0A4C1ZJZ1_EUMVA|nr:hypothetical protein EVAR_60696_1 [Eumeta japonica]
MNEQIRRKWLKLARRDDARILSVDSRMYFCEDHFDKAVQAGPKYKDQALSPLKPLLVSSFTSPFKVKTFKKSRPSEMGKITRNIFTEDEPSDGEISLYSGDIRSHSPSVHSLQTKSSSDCSEILEDYKKQQQATETLSNTLKDREASDCTLVFQNLLLLD